MQKKTFFLIKVARPLFRFSLYFFGFFLICQSRWLEKNFGHVGLDQIFYHLRFGGENLLSADHKLVFSFIKWCVLLPCSLSLLAVLLERTVHSVRAHGWKATTALIQESINTYVIPPLRLIGHMTSGKAPLVLMFVALLYWAGKVSAIGYIKSYFGEDYFRSHYVSPAGVRLEATGERKNLVLIYVESLETTYGNRSIFGRNLLNSLDKLKGVSFTKYEQTQGTSWTIAGITATQCGIPLKSVSLYDGNQNGERSTVFLPGAVCLGDILKSHGYKNVFLGGASLEFAGKGKFLESHGYSERYGREEWVAAGNNSADMSGWGLYDDKLFENAKVKLKELHDAGRPFNLTILTVDMHHPQGTSSAYCAEQYSEAFQDIVECTAGLVANFVQYIKANDYLQNTNVVILGDHLAMTNSVADKLKKAPHRYVYNSFISSHPLKKNREEIVHFDLFPTILAFLGIEVPQGRLALGYSAFGSHDQKPPAERIKGMNDSLLNRSDIYSALWENDASRSDQITGMAQH
jgi:phosphoglycerol transferase